MKPEFVRNPYNYDSDALSNETGLFCKDESLTEQEHVEESDINYIAEKFMRTGQMPQLLQMPTYEQFEGIFDFQSAMNLIVQAKQEFMRLPAKIRTRFENDPQQLIAFLENPENRKEAEFLGLIEKPDDDNLDTATLRQPHGDNDEQQSSRRSTTQSQPEATTRPRGTEATENESPRAKKPRLQGTQDA